MIAQRARLDELRRLALRKLELEKALTGARDELWQAYRETRSILQAVFAGKIQDVEAGISTVAQSRIGDISWGELR